MKYRYLSRSNIILINRMTVAEHGGNFVPPDNLLNPAPLEYLVETVAADLFGEPLYPTVADKAALYMFNIISNHVFQDGNKRTGLEAANVFLQVNGYRFNYKLRPVKVGRQVFFARSNSRDEHLIDFTLAVAAGQVPLEACRQWFATNIEPVA